MFRPLSVLPLQLACQLLVSKNFSVMNVNLVKEFGDTSIPKLATELPNDYTVFLDVGLAYKHYKSVLTWSAARKYCIAQGGNLAVIDSYEKLEFVIRISRGTPSMHTGMHRVFDSGEWIDVKDGLPAVAIPWRSASQETDMTNQCMSMMNSGDIGLFANKCNLRLSFICEVPIFKD